MTILPGDDSPTPLRQKNTGSRRRVQFAALAVLVIALLAAGGWFIVHDSSSPDTERTLATQKETMTFSPSPVLWTGTIYNDADRNTQIRNLVAAVDAGTALPPEQAQEQWANIVATSTPLPLPQEVANNPLGKPADPVNLADQELLANCLKSLGAKQSAAAVDLALFATGDTQREVAVVVLPETNNTYNVWVVGRGCGVNSQPQLVTYFVTPAQ